MSTPSATGAPGRSARDNVGASATPANLGSTAGADAATVTDRDASVIDAAACLVHWLTTGPVQQDDGGVAGWVDADGRAAYVYPEIAGYFLQWLTWRATQGDSRRELERRAGATQRWLAGWAHAEGPPPTRVHLVEGHVDWRNDAVFCFDLAMVLRGLAAAAEQRLIAIDVALVDAVCRELDLLVGIDGQLDACRVHPTRDVAFPDRWSTRRGAFLAKAAAGIDFAAARLPCIPPRLRDAAMLTFDASLLALRETPHSETHPLLYALEGYLNWPQHPGFARNLPTVGACLDRLVERCDALGRVPESDDGAGPARLDIVAQTIRAGLLVDRHRGTTARGAFQRKLVRALCGAVTADGALPFVRDAAPPQRNAWATMFASQALAWAGGGAAALSAAARDPLLV